MIDFPTVLDLKDNEYITAIYGTGTEFIKTLNIETNFYRKIKQGAKMKSELPSPRVETVQGLQPGRVGTITHSWEGIHCGC